MADGNHILQLCLEDTILISLYSLSSSFHLPVSSVFFPPPRYLRRRWVSKNIPVEILTRTNSDQRITIRQRREDTDPIPRQHILLYSLFPHSFSVLLCWAQTVYRGARRKEGQIPTHSFEFSNCARTAMISSFLLSC